MIIPKAVCRFGKYVVLCVLGISLLSVALQVLQQFVQPETRRREYHIDPYDWTLPPPKTNVTSPEEYEYQTGVGRLFNRLWMPEKRMLLVMPQFIIGGPSARHRSFKAGVLYALYHKRAIVTTPFANFYYKESGDEQFWWDFNETFDVERLGQIITLVSPHYFREQCRGVAKLLAEPHVIRHDGYERDFNQSRLHMMQKCHIEVPALPAISRSFEEVESRYKAADGESCLCMYKPGEITHMIAAEIPESLQPKLLTLINQHLTRPLYIRKTAQGIIDYVRNYGNYIAFEWHPTGLELKDVTQAISRFMKRHNIEVAYVVHPSFLNTEVEIALREVIPHMFSYRNAIAIAFLQNSRFDKEKYLWSLLEQEIAFQADVFVSSDHSNWASFVVDERTAFNKTTYSLQAAP